MLEVCEIFIMLGIQTLFTDEAPETLNQIEIRRIWRQEQQFDVQLCGPLSHSFAILIPRIIEYERNWRDKIQLGKFLEKFADTFCINVGLVRDRDKLICYRVDSTKNIESLAST